MQTPTGDALVGPRTDGVSVGGQAAEEEPRAGSAGTAGYRENVSPAKLGGQQPDSRRRWRRRRACILVLGLLGATLIAMGFFSRDVANASVNRQLQSEMRLDSKTEVFNTWEDPTENDVTTYVRIMAWNVTNPTQVAAGAKPDLQLVGPWTYAERTVKWDIQYTNDETIVEYRYNKTYHFVDTPCRGGDVDEFGPGPSLGSGANDEACSLPEDVPITTLNAPLLSVVEQLQVLPLNVIINFKSLRQIAYNYLLNAANTTHRGLFMTRPIKEVVFGYEDPVMTHIGQLLKYLSSLGFKIDVEPPTTWQLIKNGSAAISHNKSSVNTGKGGLAFLGSYVSWAGNFAFLDRTWRGCDDELDDLWANQINGTEGWLFAPKSTQDSDLYLFSDLLKRSLQLSSTGETATYDGLELLRFRLNETVFQNASEFGPNCGFSHFGPSGVLNLSAVTALPLFLSKPYFLDGSPEYLENITGFFPATFNHSGVPRADFDTYFDIQPTTGTAFSSHRRLQFNLRAEGPVRGIAEFANTRPGGFYLPVFHSDESLAAGQSKVARTKQTVVATQKAGEMVAVGGTVGGASLLLLVLLVLVVGYLYRRWGANRPDAHSAGAGAGEKTTLLGLEGGARGISRSPSPQHAPCPSASATPSAEPAIRPQTPLIQE